MDVTTAVVLPMLMGVLAGLRAMTAPAAVTWAVRVGSLDLAPTGLAFLGHAATRWILTVLAVGELVTDKLPATPSRTVPIQFGTRLVTGALSGAVVGANGGALVTGLIAGMIGSIVGTLGGRAIRARLATALGADRPAALVEDAMAIGGAVLVMAALP